jgi:hypothetical protein
LLVVCPCRNGMHPSAIDQTAVGYPTCIQCGRA